MRNSEYLLCALLDCGYADLAMLDDVGYDMNEIVADAIDNYRKVTLNALLATIFLNGLDDLASAYRENKERIVEDINDEIESLKIDYSYNVADDEDWENSEEWEKSEEYQRVYELEELLIDMIDYSPFRDGDYFVNCLDSHIYVPHMDFYRKYMKDEVEEIERNMGISFDEN